MKTNRIAVLMAITLLTCFKTFAQSQQNNWYFGWNAGLNFSSGNPVATVSSSINTNEGCAAYSSNTGVLLFYTNGNVVYNQLHLQMPNGFSLSGGSNCSQSALVVPKPGSTTQYYLFTLAQSASSSGLRYSIVDMSLDGGKGDVINKNTSLLQIQLTEKMSATYHSNGQDVWVAVHENNSNFFYSFLVSINGIGLPVITSVGTMHSGSGSYNGSMKFSPSGTKLATAMYGNFQAEIFDFNKTTGVFSNPIPYTLPNSYRPYGIEFSPNSSLLYISNTDNSNAAIYQLNLNAGTPAAIVASATAIHSKTYSFSSTADLQLGPDRKIYFALTSNSYLGCINEADSIGAACNVTDSAVNLTSGRTCRFGLPNFITGMADHIDMRRICLGDTTLFNYSNLFQLDSVSWDFGDASSGVNNFSNLVNPGHYYSAPGIYNIVLTKYKWGGATETIATQVTIYSSPVLNLGSDTTVCASIVLNAGAGFNSYLWSNGSTAQLFNVDSNGTYSVTVSNMYGCFTRDSIHINVNPLPIVNIGKDTSLCGISNFLLNAGNGFSGYLWNTGAATQQINVFQSGNYTITVTDANGCKKSDTIQVAFHPLPYVNLGPDVSVCVQHTLNAGIGFNSYVWSTGSTNQSININTSGQYWVFVTDAFTCSNRDTINIAIHALPLVNLGNDTTICSGNTLTLTPGNGFVSYLWNNGTNSSTLNVSNSGAYYVTVQDSFCSAADTIVVNAGTCTPVASVAASDSLLCLSGCVDFSDISVNGPTSWFWYFPNAVPDTSTAQNPTHICYPQSGNYPVTLIACNGAGCNTLFLPSFIQVGAPQNVSITLSNDTLYALPANLSYEWHEFSQPGVVLSTNPYYVITQTGYYYAVATNSYGCTSTSNIMLVTGMQDVVENGIKIIYPVNGNDPLQIISDHIQKLDCVIYDNMGRIIFENDAISSSINIPVTRFSKGLYILKLTTGRSIVSKKFVIVR